MLDRIKQDVYKIVTGEFSVDITITPTSMAPFVVKGLPVRITQQIEDHDGSYVSGPFSHVSIMEQDLIDNGASPRKDNKLATMKGWQLEWTDAIQTWTYRVSETHPDSTLGRISLILKDG